MILNSIPNTLQKGSADFLSNCYLLESIINRIYAITDT